MSHSLELEFQAMASLLMRLPGIELLSFGRAASPLSHRVIPRPLMSILVSSESTSMCRVWTVWVRSASSLLPCGIPGIELS